MKFVINKTNEIHGVVTPPSSKSQTIRALFLATLARGTSILKNVLICDDTNIAKKVSESLGAKIERQENGDLKVVGSGLPLKVNEKEINTGNSGITTRFVMPILGLRNNNQEKIILDCSEQMKKRPLKSLTQALSISGLNIVGIEKEHTCPLQISGGLKGSEIKIDGLTSQYLSALLLSLPCAKGSSKIIVENLHERPYIEMTLSWLDLQNIEYKHFQVDDCDIFHIEGGQEYQSFEKNIPIDFSSASYLIAAAVLIPGEVKIKNVDMNEPQGDKRLISILIEMGANITIINNELLIRGGLPLQGITIDANDIPDMLPTLAVIATQAEGQTKIINCVQARIKETDRIHSMSAGLGAMGAYVVEKEDGLKIRKSELTGAVVEGYDDHRTVMALSLAGMLAKGETVISDAEAINKTFPNYVEVMKELGADMAWHNVIPSGMERSGM